MTLPDKIAPMLLTSSEPFDDLDYIYEVKWDGWRCLAFFDDGETRLQSRSLRNLNATFPDLLEAIGGNVDDGIVLDGEVVTFFNGKPDFFRLQRRTLSRPTPRLLAEVSAVFIVFDMLYFNGESIMTKPLEERRELLKNNVHWTETLQFSQSHDGIGGCTFFDAVNNMGLEGIVAKKKSSLYYPSKRSPYWVKSKTLRRSIFNICGYFASKGKVTLALANQIDDDTWGFWGFVSSGITGRIAEDLKKMLLPLHMDHPPQFAWLVSTSEYIQWVHPEIKCKVEYLEITPGLRLRHPVLVGLEN